MDVKSLDKPLALMICKMSSIQKSVLCVAPRNVVKGVFITFLHACRAFLTNTHTRTFEVKMKARGESLHIFGIKGPYFYFFKALYYSS